MPLFNRKPKTEKQILKIAKHYPEPIDQRPAKQTNQHQRIAAVADMSAKHFEGDFIEIGAHVGLTTIELLRVAEHQGRRVVVIDPWITGTQNCYGHEHDRFIKRTKPYAHLLDVIRLRSQDSRVHDELEGRQFAFAFVDGLHTFGACYQDLELVKDAGIIAIDDIAMLQVANAFAAFMAKYVNEYETMDFDSHMNIREIYLWRQDA